MSIKNVFLRLQEGANINKSLTTLGKVISALAEVVSTVSVFSSFLSFSYCVRFDPVFLKSFCLPGMM